MASVFASEMGKLIRDSTLGAAKLALPDQSGERLDEASIDRYVQLYLDAARKNAADPLQGIPYVAYETRQRLLDSGLREVMSPEKLSQYLRQDLEAQYRRQGPPRLPTGTPELNQAILVEEQFRKSQLAREGYQSTRRTGPGGLSSRAAIYRASTRRQGAFYG